MVTQNKVYPLDKGCTILGSFEQLPEVEVGSCDIDGEAIVLSFTDGLTDLKNEEGDYFSEDMLYAFTAENYRLSAKALNQKLMEQIEVFKGSQAYPDDFTVLTCKIFAP